MSDFMEVAESPHEMTEEFSATNSGQESPAKTSSMDGNDSNRSSISTFVSNRMMAYSKLAKDSVCQRHNSDMNGNVETHGASIIQRKLALENAASTAASRQSSISAPSPYPEKRFPRAEWIRQSSPPKTQLEEIREIPSSTSSSRNSSGTDRRLSQARVEMPKLLAHVNVMQRASQFVNSDALSREDSFNGSSRKGPERVSSITPPEPSSPSKTSVPFQSQQPSLWPRVESPERKRYPQSTLKMKNIVTSVMENGGQSNGTKVEKVVTPPPPRLTRQESESEVRNEMPSLFANVKVSERASMFTVLDDGCRVKNSSKNRDEVPALLAHVKVSERASIYNNKYADAQRPAPFMKESRKSFSVAQNKLLVTSRRGSSGTFSTTIGQNHLCLLCDKVVHNMEIVISGGGVWHKQCFTCGALSDLGCKRVLITPISPDYFHHFGCPFCHGCTNKIFMHGGVHFHSNGLSEEHSSNDPMGYSPGREHSSVPFEEHSKAKTAYRNRVRAGISQPHSPHSDEIGESIDGVDLRKFDTENIVINHTFLFSEIYQDPDEELEKKRLLEEQKMESDTETAEYLDGKSSTKDYAALNYVLERLQILEDIRIKEAMEARDEYFHRFESTTSPGNETCTELNNNFGEKDDNMHSEGNAFDGVQSLSMGMDGGNNFAMAGKSNAKTTNGANGVRHGEINGNKINGNGVPHDDVDVDKCDNMSEMTNDDNDSFVSTVNELNESQNLSRILLENGSEHDSNKEKSINKLEIRINMNDCDNGEHLINNGDHGDYYNDSNEIGKNNNGDASYKNGGNESEEEGIRRISIGDDNDEMSVSSPTSSRSGRLSVYGRVGGIVKSVRSSASCSPIKKVCLSDSNELAKKEREETISEKIKRKKSLTQKKEIQSVYHEIFEKKYDDNVVGETISEKIIRNKSIIKKKDIQSVYHEIFEKKCDESVFDKYIRKKQKTEKPPVLWKF